MRKLHRHPLGVLGLIALLACLVNAQNQPATKTQPAAPSGPQPVIIQRQLVQLTRPDRYRVPLHLEPVRFVTVTAEFEGVIRSVPVKPGQKVEPQFEVVRFESERLILQKKRAQAAKKLAEVQLQQAQISGGKEAVELGRAQLAVAEAELAVANYDESKTSVRTPYAGTILDVFVQPGQRVKPGQKLVMFGDLSRMRCRLPVDRKETKAGQSIQVRVEDLNVAGRISSVVALPDEFQQLRDLSVSVGAAIVEFDNAAGALQHGQTVFSSLVPSQPVTRAPLSSIHTSQSGVRVVQVLREHVVRNVNVQLHGQVGTEEVFVSGQFTDRDELILSTSVELADGTAVRPSTPERFANTVVSSNEQQGTTKPSRPKQQVTKKKKAGAAGF